MSSTVTSTTFFLDLIETIDINGVKQQAVKKMTKNLVTDYNHRILTLAANSTSTLITLGAGNEGGQATADDIQYIRVSNLDDETSIRLIIELTDGANGSFHLEIPALQSHLVSTKQAVIVPNEGAFGDYGTISKLKAVTPVGSTVDVELFLISK